MPTSHLLQFFGGLSLFFYGVFLIQEGLTLFAGDRFKSMIVRATQSRIKAFFTGILVTFFFQSSSATSIMTVGLAGSGLITLAQAMAVSLGAGIGTTIVVFFLAVRQILQYGLLFVIFGLMLRFFSERSLWKNAGGVFLGFGLLFFSMGMMTDAMVPLATLPLVKPIFEVMVGHPWWSFLLALIMTGVLHSSSVLFGLLISMAYSGVLTIDTALPFVLGANVGTSVTAITVSLNARLEGRRSAWINLLLRLGVAIVLLPFSTDLAAGFHQLNQNVYRSWLGYSLPVSTEIALYHFLYNLLVAVIFLPLLPLGQKLIVWLIPPKGDEERVFGAKYLDVNALETPSLAFAQINRELVRMGEIVQGMWRDLLVLFQHYDPDRVADIESRDHKVDTLYRAIKLYLARLRIDKLEAREANLSIHLMTVANELEGIGDTIDRHLLRLAHSRWNKGLKFSEEGWKEICEIHQESVVIMELTVAALSSGRSEVASQVAHRIKDYDAREAALKLSHLKRLHLGLKESIETSAMHLELMALFRQVNMSLLLTVSHLLNDGGSVHVD